MNKNLIANTRIQIAAILLLFNFDLRALVMVPFAVGVTVGIELLLTYIKKKQLYLPASTIVTGMLIGLLIAPSQSPLMFILAGALAVLSKHFLGAGVHRHIFNPAAFGIFTTSLLFGIPVAWWAVAWHPMVAVLVLLAGYVLYRLKRLWLPVTFLLSYGVYLLLVAGSTSVVPLLFDATVFLFAFVMLPEPITSPAAGFWKYLFGPLVVLFVFLFGRLGGFPDVFLAALLVGNLVKKMLLDPFGPFDGLRASRLRVNTVFDSEG